MKPLPQNPKEESWVWQHTLLKGFAGQGPAGQVPGYHTALLQPTTLPWEAPRLLAAPLDFTW